MSVGSTFYLNVSASAEFAVPRKNTKVITQFNTPKHPLLYLMFYSTFTHSSLFIFEKPQKYLLIIIKLLKMDILERKYSLLYHSIIIAKFEEQYLKEFSVVSQRAKASHVIKIAYFNGNFIRYTSGIFDT